MNTSSISAAEVLNRFKYNSGRELLIPIDVDAIAKMLGVGVRYDPSLEDEDIIGQIGFEGNLPIVVINPFQNSYEPRRRFTLAHELGHYCLHGDRVSYGFRDNRKTMSRSHSYWDLMESEANNFAAQLLMPTDAIIDMSEHIVMSHRQLYGHNSFIYPGELVRRLSSAFVVSNKAMEYRLLNLGIVRSEDF